MSDFETNPAGTARRLAALKTEFSILNEAVAQQRRTIIVYRAALERIAGGCDLSNEAQAIAREALNDE